MKRLLLVSAALAAALALTAAPASARGGGGGGGRGGGGHGGGFRGGGHGFHGHHFHGHSRVFVGGFFWDPFFYYPPYYAAPYYYPYPYPYAYYPPPPPPDDAGWTTAPPESTEPGAAPEARAETQDTEARSASYGLVQLRGVPDDASVDLDGRFWMQAKGLDDRWLALPRGSHTIAVRMEGYRTVERTIDVTPGKNVVLRIGPLPKA
ncbi:MAG TPA: PEGA domain-containing protein [Candidatus Binatia bacterium]|nr:PEGA domain-containing protein [Candidatus Binatia bacterium]